MSKKDEYILHLSDRQLKAKRHLQELWQKIEVEEGKGIFPTMNRSLLYTAYYRYLCFYEIIDKALESLCPPLQNMY